MRKPITLSAFFPAYNEEDNLRSAVEQALSAIQSQPYIDDYEIIIVNDGSKDDTRAIADALARENPHVRAIHHAVNKGYGAALRTGIKEARFDYIFFTDTDLQFDIYEIWKLLEQVPEYKVVLGYRAPRRDPFMRILNAKGWNVLNRIFFGLKARDIDCAFKLFKRELVQNLELKSQGAMMSAEILIRLQRQGIKFKEVPVTHLPRTMGSPTGAKPSVIMRAFQEMFQLYNGELGYVTQKQAIRFAIVGVTNTLIDMVTYFALSRLFLFFMSHLVLTKSISFTIGSISSFALNRNWTFSKKGKVRFVELAKFYSTVFISILINAASMHLLLNVAHLNDLVALVLATVFTLGWNFTLSKFWVFNEKLESQTGSVAASI